MKYKFTPFIIAAIGLLLYAAYYVYGIYAYGKGGNLGGLVVLISVFSAGFCVLISWIFRKLFKRRIKEQVITELIITVIISFVFYQNNGRLMLHVPRSFKGYIVIVYGVDHTPKLSSSFFNNDINITVPHSGIFLTSSKRGKNISIVDSTNINNIKIIKAGYGVPILWDSVNCENKKYELSVLVFGSVSSTWAYQNDTLIRNIKKELACKMISE